MRVELWRHAPRSPADPPAGAGAAGGAAGGPQPGAGAQPPPAPGAAGGAAPTPPQPPAWMSQFSSEDRAAVIAKDFKGPDDIVKHLARLETEAGANRIAVPDDKSSTETRQAFWKAGGWPEKADAYELPTENVDPNFVKWARETFHSEGVSAAQAKSIAN